MLSQAFTAASFSSFVVDTLFTVFWFMFVFFSPHYHLDRCLFLSVNKTLFQNSADFFLHVFANCESGLSVFVAYTKTLNESSDVMVKKSFVEICRPTSWCTFLICCVVIMPAIFQSSLCKTCTPRSDAPALLAYCACEDSWNADFGNNYVW